MAGNIEISRANASDAVEIHQLAIKTFVDTFGMQNRKEDMDKYVAGEMSLEKLTDELKNEANYFFIVHYNGKLVGYSKMRVNSEPDIVAIHPIELERIYVLEQYQGLKAGAALMEYCLDFARANNHDVLWLGVWELNHKAVKFYKSRGFELCGSHPFLLGDDMQTDVLMRKKLK